jgi:uncharacterized protein (TIGR00661 family)
MSKNILVAPLNWGLGHATRCIPIIKKLEEYHYTPILASDGNALELLKKEFPHLICLALPSYEIKYSKKGKNFKWKLVKNSPKTIRAIVKEKKVIKKWIEEYNLSGIISDNRLGVRSKKIPSVFITHQLTVLSGKTTWISSKIHQFYISKFTECWVPDIEGPYNLSGKLGHLPKTHLKLKYIGVLSRLNKKNLPIKNQLMVLLSGPEPQRSLLEEKLKLELIGFNKQVIFIKGIIEAKQKIEKKGLITYVNFMQFTELEAVMNESDLIICRSGYSTVMDLIKIEKKAFFIPTPGQYEQEYLAKKYEEEGLAPFALQENFSIDLLNTIDNYKGFQNFSNDSINWKNRFKIFQ